MTTGSRVVSLPSSEDTEGTDFSRTAHPYRFKKGAQIARRYEVVAPLGFGGFSEVYHCWDLTLHRDVAVKVLFEKGPGLEEARAAARLRHTRIVQVYDVLALDDGTPFIVFDYVEGETLKARLNRAEYRRLPLDMDTFRIIHQVAQALDYAHRQKVIHRDVKPSNIMLDLEGNAYLTDFGLAEVKMKRPVSEESALTTEIQQRLSGTIPYMAPEQLKEGRPGNERSDLYSLGVVIYEMLTGQLPYRGQDASLIIQIVTNDPYSPTLANPELPEGVGRVLLRTLDKDPDKRPDSCVDFAKELQAAAEAQLAANEQYPRALELFEDKQWRQALAAFEALQRQAPGFKETARYLEQARHQVSLLEFYEQAQEALKQGKYQVALDKLNILTQMAPDYDEANLRQQAREGLAQEERRSLDEQYQQAVQQFGNEEYQACLDTLAVIRERDPDYPDSEGIEEPARKRMKRQQHLRTLHTQGVEQMAQEKWDDAVATFLELQQESPGYEDVETRLVTARHLVRLSSLLQEARRSLDEGGFAACVDKLGELQDLDPDYKIEEVAQLRREALDRLHEQVSRLIRQEKFEESLVALAALRERSSDYPDVEELDAQAREGIRIRDLRARLDGLYDQAVEQLNRAAYTEALGLWKAIEQQKEDLDYTDSLGVKARIREGLYNQAQVALARKDPQRALELWHQVHEVDPDYPDSQGVEEQARARIEQQENVRRWGVRAGGGAVGLLIVGILLAVLVRNCGGGPVPSADTPTWTPLPTATVAAATATPTVKPTQTPSVAPTAVPSTAAPTVIPATRVPSPTPTSAVPTATPTITPTHTPSPTPTATPTPDNVATATISAGIFAAPDATSTLLGGISEGEQVEVLGRSAVGQWYYVRDDQGVEGFSYAPRFEWSGDYDALPVKQSISPVPTRSGPSPSTSVSTLEMDLWSLDGTGDCRGGMWYKSVFIQGRGGNGVYTYYWNGEKMAGPISGYHSFEVHSTGGAIIGVGKVVSGDGQVIERELYIRAYPCGG